MFASCSDKNQQVSEDVDFGQLANPLLDDRQRLAVLPAELPVSREAHHPQQSGGSHAKLQRPTIARILPQSPVRLPNFLLPQPGPKERRGSHATPAPVPLSRRLFSKITGRKYKLDQPTLERLPSGMRPAFQLLGEKYEDVTDMPLGTSWNDCNGPWGEAVRREVESCLHHWHPDGRLWRIHPSAKAIVFVIALCTPMSLFALLGWRALFILFLFPCLCCCGLGAYFSIVVYLLAGVHVLVLVFLSLHLAAYVTFGLGAVIFIGSRTCVSRGVRIGRITAFLKSRSGMEFTNNLGVERPYLLFHGTKDQNHAAILSNNFVTGETWWDWFQGARALDAGWYGKGVYLTSNPVYAQHYINFRGGSFSSHFKLPERGRSVSVVGVWANPGNTFTVTDMSYYGNPCETGYESHMVHVRYCGDFFPLQNSWGAEADEWVLFEKKRLLPMFIIELHFD